MKQRGRTVELPSAKIDMLQKKKEHKQTKIIKQDLTKSLVNRSDTN